MPRILIATRGSFGDFHPFLGIAQVLRRRGHTVVFVTNAHNLDGIRQEGFEAHAFDAQTPVAAHANIDGSSRGSQRMLRRLSGQLRAEYALIHQLAQTCDMLVGAQTSLALPLAARVLRRPWVFAAVSPMAFLSLDDPPYVHGLRLLRRGGPLPDFARNACLWLLRFATAQNMPSYRPLERQLGLVRRHPLFEARYSPHGNLALFSTLLAAPQADWPKPVTACGFTFFTPQGNPPEDAALADFLRAGPPPVVFTLGSVSRATPRGFYRHAMAACAALGLRAVLVKKTSVDLGPLPASVFAANFAPYAQLFAQARAVVHHGGVGTIAQCLRWGQPQLVVPLALDQFDNALRTQALGCARVLPFGKVNTARLTAELQALLADPAYAQTAQRAAVTMAQERGAEVAADAIARLCPGSTA
jgi:rhamnosyltransferase subunit B